MSANIPSSPRPRVELVRRREARSRPRRWDDEPERTRSGERTSRAGEEVTTSQAPEGAGRRPPFGLTSGGCHQSKIALHQNDGLPIGFVIWSGRSAGSSAPCGATATCTSAVSGSSSMLPLKGVLFIDTCPASRRLEPPTRCPAALNAPPLAGAATPRSLLSQGWLQSAG